MAQILKIEKYRDDLNAQKEKLLSINNILDEIHNVEELSNIVNDTLNDMCNKNEEFSKIISFAIGKFAATNLFDKYGRSKTMSFFNECIDTQEICNDILNQIEDHNKLS